MTDELSAAVHAVFDRGLDLKARLDRGDEVSVDAEQAEFRRLLAGPDGADRWADFVGDAADPTGVPRGGPPFLGLRYALACWVDELVILYTRWDAVWNERKLEVALYGTNDRAWRFWEQASAAERRPDPALLGVYLLCVALGFRGDYRDDPRKLTDWVAAAKERAGRPPGDPPSPPARPPAVDVPPLRGRDDMQQMALAAGMVLLLGLPVLAYLAVRQLAG
jgi:type VI secretion system protein ImpK